MTELGVEVSSSQVVDLDPLVDPRWAGVLSRHRADVFHSPAWLSVLDYYEFSPRARVVLSEDGDPVAGLVYCSLARGEATRIVALPFSDFADPLVSSRQEWDAIVGAFGSGDILEVKALRDQHSRDDAGFEMVSRAKWHRLDLRAGTDAVWDGMHGSGRRAIRKAMDAPVDVVVARSTHDLRSFFELHLSVRKNKYRLLAQPYGFLRAIWDAFIAEQRGVLLLARHEGSIIAGTMLLEWGDTLYYKFNASDFRYLEYFPNDALVWEAIAHAYRRGLSYLDFGLSDWDQEGLHRFKAKFGAEEGQIDRLRRSTAEVRPDPLSVQLGEVTRILTAPDVPDEVTESAGEAFYRYFA
jgi:CelD/BcsL family acetyltransferase involved in cellulose biosynthesis